MDRDAFAARDVTDNFFAADRIAALRSIHQQIVKTFHLKFCVGSQSENTFDDRCDPRLFFGYRFLHPVRNQPGNNLLRRDLPVADRREQILDFARAVFRQNGVELAALKQFFDALFIFPSFLFDHLAAEFNRFLAFLFREPMADFVSGARRLDE